MFISIYQVGWITLVCCTPTHANNNRKSFVQISEQLFNNQQLLINVHKKFVD